MYTSLIFCEGVGRFCDHTINTVVCRDRSSKSLCVELLSWGGDLESLDLPL